VDDLQGLVQKDRIRDAVIRLFDATDERDWPAVRACFADTVRFDMTSLVGGEPQDQPAAAIVQAWDEGLAPLAAIHHQVGNLRIVLDGDTASATCHGIASHFLPNPAGSTRTFVGTYALHLARAGAEWRIDGFRFDLKYIAGNHRLEEVADPADPSAE
jgi:hypothetical protein